MSSQSDKGDSRHRRRVRPPSQVTFRAGRMCVVCHRAFAFPVENPNGWSVLDLGGPLPYWVCPDCTALDHDDEDPEAEQ